MRKEIMEQLRAIELGHECKILYACESGSRAWGFASPDSDYDLRFIYVHKVEWYLLVKSQADTVEQMAPNDLDLSGWELRKMLRLFYGCNLALNEWFDSPEVYYENTDFTCAIRELIPVFFNPRKGLHHYLSMAEKIMNQNFCGNEIQVKKAFYILRPLLACTWIMKFRTMPPTRFAALRDQSVPVDLQTSIDALLEQKKHVIESQPVTLEPVITKWIHSTLELIRENANQVEPQSNHDWTPLDNILKHYIER